MTWHFTPHTAQPVTPVDNGEEVLLVVPNERGGFSLRFSDSSLLIGHYTTAKEAETYARTQCVNVKVVTAQPAPTAPVLGNPLTKALNLIHTT